MRRRIAALLLTLVAVFGVTLVAAPQPARADGIIGNGVEAGCRIGTGPVMGSIFGIAGKGGVAGLTGADLCDKLGDAAQKKANEAWESVWDSVLGDVIKSAADGVKWIVKKVLTVALLGPSVDLAATGLWGTEDENKDGKPDPTLSGMLMWLGLVIAAGGFMWQLGKMAVTGQVKHMGRAMAGWVENIFLSALGVSMFALLLMAADALSAGLVNATFANDGKAYERIVAVMMPNGISNPILVLGVAQVLLIVGFIQLVMIFLRQSAIPIICLLLPVAGAGRAGGDAMRQWAPKLITTGLVVVAYKPILAIIYCVGFAEFGHSQTLTEWLRGLATMILAGIAPGPLTKIFAPFGEAVGGGMSAGGASGALSAAAGYIGGGKGDKGDSGGGEGPTSAVEHAQYVQQSMGKQDGGRGGDAQAQAARNEAAAKVPAQAAGPEGAAGVAGATGTATGTATASTGAATAAAGPPGLIAAATVQVLDGVNDTIQGAAGQVGGGNQQ